MREITEYDLAMQQALHSSQDLTLAILDADIALAGASALQHDMEWRTMVAEHDARHLHGTETTTAPKAQKDRK